MIVVVFALPQKEFKHQTQRRILTLIVIQPHIVVSCILARYYVLSGAQCIMVFWMHLVDVFGVNMRRARLSFIIQFRMQVSEDTVNSITYVSSCKRCDY